jgi:UDP-galactopyranose mutase
MPFDWVIVGAGLVGSTLAERIANELGERVLIVEARCHIAGNTFDEPDEHGILVHRYGPHAFHTNDERVWAYLSRFTKWRPYEHRVLADVGGQFVPVPFNLNSLDVLIPVDQATRIREMLLATYGPEQEIPILRFRDAQQWEVRKVADFVYEKIFYGYTLKQWGLTPEELGPAVMGRVPIRLSRDDRCFRDRHQGVPKHGYTAMVRSMLAHERIEVALGTPFEAVRNNIGNRRVIYTGPIESYFEYIHGALPYRSLRFRFEHLTKHEYQAAAQINYPNSHEYTRTIEHKHITGQIAEGTTITKEYPQAHEPGKNEPYYPIPRPENQAVYAKYASEAARLRGRVFFAGRLADYKYYNMDQAVARALSLFEREVAPAVVSAARA